MSLVLVLLDFANSPAAVQDYPVVRIDENDAGDGEWRTVDLTDGTLSDVVATTKTYTDLATCGTYE
ncbi:hypothetical protein HSBGL_0057 [Halapricum desulfuricans]|uniref:Uncharacterized protein n=1 Tax=Halapricum desulfuricans TaxID=2841257 RepID=A0A897NHQ5_9EURY|nr:hypothetical protein [Halapricum desulfuricans]QSG10503.1 hypothetical protein HSBGL_0057 [Halapricum desulfuricans]